VLFVDDAQLDLVVEEGWWPSTAEWVFGQEAAEPSGLEGEENRCHGDERLGCFVARVGPRRRAGTKKRRTSSSLRNREVVLERATDRVESCLWQWLT